MDGKHKPSIDFGYPTEAHGRIPSFSSIEEEAEFWDTHDTTELDGDWEPVEVTIGPDFPRMIMVQLSPDDSDILERLAEQEGTEPSALAERWIVEQLRGKRAG